MTGFEEVGSGWESTTKTGEKANDEGLTTED
jgi:hypothetical protein